MPRPLAGTVSKDAGTWAFSSSVSSTGRMAAWGQHMAQRLHWMQLSAFHLGTLVATPRLEKAEVPFSQVPSSTPCFWNTDTGSLSPCCRSMGSTMSRTNAEAFLGSATGVSAASAQEAGISTFTAALMPRSTALSFLSTISWPAFLK